MRITAELKGKLWRVYKRSQLFLYPQDTFSLLLLNTYSKLTLILSLSVLIMNQFYRPLRLAISAADGSWIGMW